MVEGGHPYFDVGKLVQWANGLDAALAAARDRKQRVLLVHGCVTCAGTRALVEKTIAKEEIAHFLNEHFVALAGNADAPDSAIEAVLARVPRREPTPVCVYLDPDGRVVHSTAGGRPPAVFLNDMTDAMMRRHSP